MHILEQKMRHLKSQLSLGLDQGLYHLGPVHCPLVQELVPLKARLLSPLDVPSALEIQVLDAASRPPHSVLGTPPGGIGGTPVPGRLRLASGGIQGRIRKERG